MIKPIIAGNWKMHKTVAESVAFARQLCENLCDPLDREVVIAPPFTALYSVAEVLKGSVVDLAAQNVHPKEQGAFTGEVSPRMLIEAGCKSVIIGHSERRALFGETDAFINEKVKAAIAAGLRPIFCIGETLGEREADRTFAVIEKQLKEGLNNLSTDDICRTVIAYEPVWAIGTGKTATPEQAEEVHAFIRRFVGSMFGDDIAARTPILYGGSVNPVNVAVLMACPDINGALVGGASLDVDSFVKLIRY